ncbi:MAG: hypothetical protein WC442_00725 [Candidatus Omnitrophota bacterium]
MKKIRSRNKGGDECGCDYCCGAFIVSDECQIAEAERGLSKKIRKRH